MTLKSLSNPELLQKLKTLSEEERRITKDVIEHIAEVDRRKLFLSLGFPSLFEYLTKEFKYSAASAQRRIDAARLLLKAPEVLEKIESGRINLSQISSLQRSLRASKKAHGKKVSLEKTREMLLNLEDKSSKETELIISKELTLPIQTLEKQRIQRDESVRVEITFSKEEMALIEEAKAFLSHAVVAGNMKEVFLHLAKRYIKQRTQGRDHSLKKVKSIASENTKNSTQNEDLTSAAEVAAQHPEINIMSKTLTKATQQHQQQPGNPVSDRKLNQTTQVECSGPAEQRKSPFQHAAPVKPNPRFISAAARRFIFNRDQACQFINPTTKKKCGSKHFLELDHIHPVWAGGSNCASNLRLLCRAHNQYRYRVGS